jgi:hypothetical protein
MTVTLGAKRASTAVTMNEAMSIVCRGGGLDTRAALGFLATFHVCGSP